MPTKFIILFLILLIGCSKPEITEEEWNQLFNKYETYVKRGYYDSAYSTAQTLLSAANGTKNKEWHEEAHNINGIITMYLGKYRESESHFQQALNYDNSAADINFNFSLLKARIGELKEAEKYVKRSLDIYEKDTSENKNTIASAQLSLANILLEQRKYEQSTKWTQKALEFGVNNSDSLIIIQAISVAAKTFLYLEDYGKAKPLYRYMINYYTAHKNLSRVAEMYNDLAAAHHLDGVYDSALFYYQRSINVKAKYSSDSSVLLTNLQNMARLYNQLNQSEKENEIRDLIKSIKGI